MAISERGGAGARARALTRSLAALAALLVMAAEAGCARSAAAPPEPPSRPRTGPSATGAASGGGSAVVFDPGEEITPEELSTIPEPVPRPAGGGAGRNLRAPLPIAQAAAPKPVAPAPASLWRVQVFATQDRGLADRMAREAALALHVAAHIDYEGSHYKVRLGDFSSEDEALPLRERALHSGYPGAFRTRCPTDVTNNAE